MTQSSLGRMRSEGFVLLEKGREGGRAAEWSPGYGSVIGLKDQHGPPRQGLPASVVRLTPFSLWSWMVLCAEPEHTYLSTNFLNTFEFEVWRKLPVNLNLPRGQSRNSGSQEL